MRLVLSLPASLLAHLDRLATRDRASRPETIRRLLAVALYLEGPPLELGDVAPAEVVSAVEGLSPLEQLLDLVAERCAAATPPLLTSRQLLLEGTPQQQVRLRDSLAALGYPDATAGRHPLGAALRVLRKRRGAGGRRLYREMGPRGNAWGVVDGSARGRGGE